MQQSIDARAQAHSITADLTVSVGLVVDVTVIVVVGGLKIDWLQVRAWYDTTYVHSPKILIIVWLRFKYSVALTEEVQLLSCICMYSNVHYVTYHCGE